MSAEQNMSIALNFLETAWRKKDFGALSHYVAQDHVAHGALPISGKPSPPVLSRQIRQTMPRATKGGFSKPGLP